MKVALRVLYVAVCLTVSSVLAVGQPKELPPPFLFGTYYEGDGLGVNHILTIKASGEIEYAGHTDAGAQQVGKGTWRLDRGIVILALKGNKSHDWTGTTTHLVPVLWDNAAYLIEVNAMAGFAATSKGRTRPRDPHGMYYIRVNPKTFDVERVAGASKLPQDYQDFYENDPVGARVSQVLSNGTVTLASKYMNRLKAGLLLTVPGWVCVDVRVLGPKAGQLVGKIIYRLNSDRRIRIGDELTSGGQYMTPGWADDPELKDPPSHQGRRSLSQFSAYFSRSASFVRSHGNDGLPKWPFFAVGR